jgi:tetratricopeptide (TPR) repeat protein
MRIFWIVILFSLTVISCDQAKNDLKANLLNNTGVDFMENKNYESAYVKFHESLALSPGMETRVQLFRNLSTCHFFLENKDSALHYSKLAYESSKVNSFAYHLNKGEYLMLNNKITPALAEFEKAKAKNGQAMEVYNNLSLIYDGSFGEKYMDLPKALENAKMAYKLNPSPTMKEELASIYFEMDTYEKSNALYQELMNEFPEIKMYQFEYGLSLYFSGDEEKGLEMMEEAAARDTECNEMLNTLFENE